MPTHGLLIGLYVWGTYNPLYPNVKLHLLDVGKPVRLYDQMAAFS